MDFRIHLARYLSLKVKNQPFSGFSLRPFDRESFAFALITYYNYRIPEGEAPLLIASHLNCWVITWDTSVGYSAARSGWPVGLVSPTFNCCLGSTWRAEVKRHWETILNFAETMVRYTIVHISPQVGTDWTPTQLKHIIQALFYFEKAFEAIVTPSRRTVNSNPENPDFEACCKSLQADGDDIIKSDGLVSIIQSRYASRDYAWKFGSASGAVVRTIEFHAPLSVRTSEHCLMWMEFAIAFVQAAAQYGSVEYLKTECDPGVVGLRQFIRRAEVRDLNNGALIDMVFHEHSRSG